MPAERQAKQQFAPTLPRLRHYSLPEKLGAFILLNMEKNVQLKYRLYR